MKDWNTNPAIKPSTYSLSCLHDAVNQSLAKVIIKETSFSNWWEQVSHSNIRQSSGAPVEEVREGLEVSEKSRVPQNTAHNWLGLKRAYRHQGAFRDLTVGKVCYLRTHSIMSELGAKWRTPFSSRVSPSLTLNSKVHILPFIPPIKYMLTSYFTEDHWRRPLSKRTVTLKSLRKASSLQLTPR